MYAIDPLQDTLFVGENMNPIPYNWSSTCRKRCTAAMPADVLLAHRGFWDVMNITHQAALNAKINEGFRQVSDFVVTNVRTEQIDGDTYLTVVMSCQLEMMAWA